MHEPPPSAGVYRCHALTLPCRRCRCSGCGECERDRVDSRLFSGTVVSGGSKMPVVLSPGGAFDVGMNPVDGDWRLDPFEARNVDFSMTLQITATALTSDMSGVRVCVLPNSYWVPSFDASLFKTVAGLATRCLNLAGRVLDARGQNATFAAISATPGKGTNFVFSDRVNNLPRRSDGWRIYVWNNGTVAAQFVLVAKVRKMSTMCSDKQDGAVLAASHTRTLNLGNTHISSQGPAGQCKAAGKVYCDDSTTSGRQLDRCFVCGGGCFNRSCEAGSCVSEGGGNVAKLRYLGEYAGGSGMAKRTTVFPTITKPCPGPTSPLIECAGEECNYKGLCKFRVESYPVDTDFLSMPAGRIFTFPPGAFALDPAGFGQNVAVRLTTYARPDQIVRMGIDRFNPESAAAAAMQGGGNLSLPAGLVRVTRVTGEQYWQVTDGKGKLHNITIRLESPTAIELVGNATVLPAALSGITFTAPATAGTTLRNRQSLLSLSLRMMDKDFSKYTVLNPYLPGSTFCGSETCTCKPGFRGVICDEMRPTNIFVTFSPLDPGLGVVPPAKSAGRIGSLGRGGHGTHLAGLVAGVGYLPTSASDANKQGLKRVAKYNSIATNATLVFVDIGNSDHPYVTPPESIGDDLMLKPYQEARARVFLNPWTCQDFAWWRKQDRSFDPEQASFTVVCMPSPESSICQRTAASRLGTSALSLQPTILNT